MVQRGRLNQRGVDPKVGASGLANSDSHHRDRGFGFWEIRGAMRFLLDCDGVLGAFPEEVVRFCNLYGRKRACQDITDDDLTPWTIQDVVDHDILKSLGCEELQSRLDQHMIDTDFCRHMPVYRGAQAFVERLRGIGEVVIVTSSYTAVPNWDAARRAWLAEHFLIPKLNVVFTSRKELVRGDYLIDDYTKNCESFGDGALCFDRPWNRAFEGKRIHSYADALRMFRRL